jgi:hypothetical protein
VKKRLERVTYEVKRGSNDYFTVIGEICEKADVHWNIKQGAMVIHEGIGVMSRKPVAVSGKYGMFEVQRGGNLFIRSISGTIATERIITGEPGHAKILNQGLAGDEGVRWKAYPGPFAIGSTYAGIIQSQNINPHPTTLMEGDAKNPSSINARFTSATGGSEKYFPMSEPSEGDVGMQHITVEPRKYNDAYGAQVCAHMWPHLSWSSTKYPEDMQAWNAAAGISLRLLDKDGAEIPHRLMITRVEERRVYFTVKALDDREPAGMRIRGQKNMTNETRMFNPVPARMPEAIRPGGPAPKEPAVRDR